MCGITGFFSYKNKIETKKYYDAHKKIAHRGPDDEGFIYKNEKNEIEHLIGDDTIEELEYRKKIYEKESSSLILGHRRLSIIDLTSAGHQPYVYENLYLVYNGEIYNYIELREELQELGYSFQTDSDTEVFLKAYHCWGIESFNKFNGMWASAIYDKNKDEILLTRDRFGIKPLYYTLVNENLIFGSEIKFIAPFFDKLESNEQMVYDYIEYGYISHTNETFFKNIYQLEKGHYAIYSSSFKLIKTKYFNLKKQKILNPITTIKKKLIDAVSIRMRSDVNIGSLLSGGMDSSSIVCIVDKENFKQDMETFTITYKEKELDYESEYVKDITNQTGFKNHSIYLKPESKTIDELVYILETPYRSFAQNAMYNLYSHISEKTDVKVLLNGSGSDEIFSGYNAHYMYYLISLLSDMKIIVFFKELQKIKDRTEKTYISLVKELIKTILIHYNLQKFFKKNLFFKNKKLFVDRQKKSKDALKNEILINREYTSLPEYLLYEDRISMFFSLEVRVPFLDYKLVNEANSLENKLLIKNGVTKYILRKSMEEIIPSSVYERKDKKGFFTPHSLWLKTDIFDNIKKELEDINKNGLFDYMNHKVIYKEFITDGSSQKIWRIYTLSRWKKVWKIN